MISIILDKTFNSLTFLKEVTITIFILLKGIFTYINKSETSNLFYTGLLIILGLVIAVGVAKIYIFSLFITIPLLFVTGIYFISLVLDIQ